MIDPAVPERLRRFPLYKGRYPVHFTVFVGPDGVPDFRVIDEARRREAFRKNWCHLCGTRMAPPYAFIGGAGSIGARTFRDGPMHVECATYAARVCPFLASPRGHYADIDRRPPAAPGAQVFDVHPDRPARMGLLTAGAYRTFKDPTGAPVCEAIDVVGVDWEIMPPTERRQ